MVLAITLVFFGVMFGTTPATAQPGVPPAGSPFQVFLPLTIQPSAVSLMEQKVVDLTNQLRQQFNCPPLAVSPELSLAAHDHIQDMADQNYFSHTDRGGHSPGWRAQQAGYSGMAGWENIAAGQATPDDVVTAWYTSLDHRRNMLDCSLTDIGVGYGYSTGSTYHSYWTEAFGRH